MQLNILLLGLFCLLEDAVGKYSEMEENTDDTQIKVSSESDG